MCVPKKVIKKLLSLFVITASILAISSPVCGASWWKQDWNHRKKLTFDNSAISEALTNFPVLVALSSTNFDFSKAQTNGADIRLIDADGTTVLKHEIEKWDNAGSNAWIWVKVPKINAGSSNDFVYIYYGNSGVADAQDAENVWDSTYMMVQHLEETSGTHYDSTSNNNDGAPAGVNQNVAGKINSADEFYGTNDYVSIADSATLDITNVITLEAWAKRDSSNTNYYGLNLLYTSDIQETLNDSNDTVSLRFTAQESKTVDKIEVECVVYGTSPVYRVGLQSDNSGEPSGSWLNGNAYGDAQPAASGDLEVDIPNTAITQGTVYHLVVEYQSGTIDSGNNIRIWSGHLPHNQKYPVDLTSDENLDVLYSSNGGSSWIVRERDPVFVLDYDDATFRGQPLARLDAQVVYGDYRQGAQFQPDSTITVSAVEFYVGLLGSPSNLNVVIRNKTDETTLIDELWDGDMITTTQAWRKHNFPSVQELSPAKTWQVYLKSPDSTNSSDRYFIRRYLGALENTTTWDGTSGIFIYSNSGQDTLNPNTSADCPFRLTLVPEIISKGRNAYTLELSADGSTLYGYINDTEISSSVSTPTNWHHYVWTYDGSEQKLYIDGTETNSTSVSGAITTNDNALTIGNFFNGIIDELRISRVARSAGWVKASYLSGNDTYLTYGAQELVPPPRGTVISIW